jgi:hypothetical protein
LRAVELQEWAPSPKLNGNTKEVSPVADEQRGLVAPQWKTINLRATVPGPTCLPAAREWLERQARKPPEKQ